MGKVFGLLGQSCQSNLAESQWSPADPVGKKEADSNMKRKGEQPGARPGAWEYPHGLVGLHNIGQTCCLNSLIQVFVMNVDFTRILKRITVPRGADEQRRSVPFQLLLLLEKMQDSRQKAVWPLELAYCLQKYNVPRKTQQMNTVLEVGNANAASSLFSWVGQEDALHCFFQPRELSSKSTCFCDNCGKKTRGKQVLIRTDIAFYKVPHKVRTWKRDNWSLHCGCGAVVFVWWVKCLVPVSFQPGGQYELFAVVAHVGMADSGHYCAYIRNAVDGKSFCFNDSNICSVSWEDIQCTYGNPNYHW
ncbi:ubl carboxyl-terminal hydrolase 18 [Cebus imitator]|uniref:ubl carboxyl-terminal hydrolase 18 n=1 Tax=Cebus imitator TaxID=2715852 RepID=UPI00189BF721|nr:ubl carboxyl-terminal hydrolase 18 [Cebus imitator]